MTSLHATYMLFEQSIPLIVMTVLIFWGMGSWGSGLLAQERYLIFTHQCNFFCMCFANLFAGFLALFTEFIPHMPAAIAFVSVMLFAVADPDKAQFWHHRKVRIPITLGLMALFTLLSFGNPHSMWLSTLAVMLIFQLQRVRVLSWQNFYFEEIGNLRQVIIANRSSMKAHAGNQTPPPQMLSGEEIPGSAGLSQQKSS